MFRNVKKDLQGRQLLSAIRLCLLLIAYCLLSITATSQQFGGTPPSVRWRQINTDTIRVIFPNGLDSQAQRIASVIHYIAKEKPVSIGKKLHKIDIVLHNQTTISNGYVSLAPFRSEFYLTPPAGNFELGSIAWADLLAVHEYRHVQQFNNFRNGLTKALYYLLGEEGFALGTGISIPDWFFEGDAVYNETLLTNQGRGRIPSFLNEYRSLWLAGTNYSWMKLRNGSLKDFVPSHYPLGYLLVNYGYEKYGSDFWSKVTYDASAFKGLFYPFQRAVQKYTGISFKTFRKNALDYAKTFSLAGGNDSSGNNKLNGASQGTFNQGTEAGIKNITEPARKYVTNYYYPYRINEDSLLYIKNTYRRISSFYLRDKSGEHRLRVRDISLGDQFSYRNGKIVYAAYKPDVRWGWRDYSEIRLLDVNTGSQRHITKKSKYFMPDISLDGSRIAAVQIAINGKSELHVLDANNGQVLKQIKSGEISLFTDPKFIDDNTLVSAVRLPDGRMALALIDVNIGSVERLTPLSYNSVGYLSVENGTVYFTASYSGNDDLFALRLADRKISQLTHSSLGNYFVNVSGGKLVFSSFTAKGYQLRELDTRQVMLQEMDNMSLQEAPVILPVSQSNLYHDILVDKVSRRNFPVKEYKKTHGLFNFHSWRPDYTDPEFTFSVYGTNVINTLASEIFYKYNQNEREHSVGFNSLYGGFFPFITLGTEFTFDRVITDSVNRREYNQLDLIAGLSIPLQFTGGRMYRYVNFGSNFVHRNEFNIGTSKNLPEADYNYLSHFFSWNFQVQKAKQNIFPRYNFSGSINHRHAISHYESFQFLANVIQVLPGLHVNHNLVISGSFQERDTLNAIFSNRFANSRGYDEFYFSRMWRLSGNYHFPITYPDWGFGNIIYFLRLRGNIFYDYTKIFSRNKQVTANLRSAGGELFFDTKWWNQLPITFGFRMSYLLDDEPNRKTKNTTLFEFVLPVSLIPD